VSAVVVVVDMVEVSAEITFEEVSVLINVLLSVVTVVFVVLSVEVVLVASLLQATNVPAMATTAKNFFI
jgi:hypothetical protein